MAEELADAPAVTAAKRGKFQASLERTNKQIRGARATSITEDAKLIYKRTVEDLQTALRRKQLDQENMLDLGPDSAFSLKMASDFKAPEWVQQHVQLGVDIRNLEIKLEIARRQYAELFDPDMAVEGAR